MSEVDAFLDGLTDEARAATRALLARAYERGFREGLSAAGAVPVTGPAAQTAVVAAPPVPVAVPGQAAGTSTAAPVPVSEPDSGGVNWTEGDGEDAEDEPVEADAPRPIMIHATIGTLMRRIERMFALDRFDIDVVVCRRGDRERRQLRANVRLKNYVLER